MDKKKHDPDDPISSLSELYDITEAEALEAMRGSIEDILGYQISTDSVTEGDRIVFYGYKDGDPKGKIIRLSPLLRTRIKKSLEKRIESIRLENFRRNNNSIIDAVIQSKNRYGLECSTRFGKALAPWDLLIKNEKHLYTPNTTLDFHINRLKNGKLILDRKSKSLVVHTLKRILPKDFKIHDINRYFGKRLKIYVPETPKKEDLERISMAFSEKIQIVQVQN